MKQYTAILIGAGLRGKIYTNKMLDSFSDKFKIVGVAEPIESRRAYIKNAYNISDDCALIHTKKFSQNLRWQI